MSGKGSVAIAGAGECTEAGGKGEREKMVHVVQEPLAFPCPCDVICPFLGQMLSVRATAVFDKVSGSPCPL